MRKEDIEENILKCKNLHDNLIKAMETEKNIECQLLVLIEMIRQIIDFVEDQVPDIEDQIIKEIKRRVDYDETLDEKESENV